jgi:hypothetical protein
LQAGAAAAVHPFDQAEDPFKALCALMNLRVFKEVDGNGACCSTRGTDADSGSRSKEDLHDSGLDKAAAHQHIRFTSSQTRSQQSRHDAVLLLRPPAMAPDCRCLARSLGRAPWSPGSNLRELICRFATMISYRCPVPRAGGYGSRLGALLLLRRTASVGGEGGRGEHSQAGAHWLGCEGCRGRARARA